MVSYWVQYLAKGPRTDFSSGLGITRIVAEPLPTGFYSSTTRTMAPPQTNPILVRWTEDASVHVPSYGLLVSAISSQGPQA